MSAGVDRNNWREGILTDLGTVSRGRSRHRPRNDPILFGGSYPFFQTGDVKTATLWLDRYWATYNDVGLEQSKLWPSQTLCITIAANIADSAILGIPGCFPDSIVGFTVDDSVADVRFVKYMLDYIQQRFQGISRGTTQDNLSLEKLLSVNFRYPPLRVQRKIGTILSTYDDLIENNSRRIKILEEMAQQIYREWFVEFRYQGHEDVPLVDSKLGSIPTEWAWKELRDVVELAYGKALKADTRRNGSVPVFGSGGAVGEHDIALVDGPGIVVGRKGNVGSVYWSDKPFFPIDTTYFVRTGLPMSYVYFALQDLAFIDSHAAVPGLSREQAYGLPFMLPDAQILMAFDDVVTPIIALKRTLNEQNTSLCTARDLLLPRLISGEIDMDKLDIETAESSA